MPWECGDCRTLVQADDDACPSCAAPKTSWTMVRDATRTFVLGGKRFEVLRGASSETWPPGDPRHEAEALAAAQVAPVLTRAAAAAVAARGHLPAARDLLRVRLHPKGHTDLTVTLGVNYEGLEADDRALSPPDEPAPRADGAVDVLVLLVFGDGHGDVPDPSFPGVHVVDVGEEGAARGFAPAVEVSALGKPPRELPTEAVGGRAWLSARFVDRAGRAPYAGRALRVEGREAMTGPDGEVVLGDMPWRDLVVSFDEGQVAVPAVHVEDLLTTVCLRFVAAPGDPADAGPPAAEDEDALDHPAWLPRPDEEGLVEDDLLDPAMTGEWDDDAPLDDFELTLAPVDEPGEPDAGAAADDDAPAEPLDGLDLFVEEVVDA